MPLPEKYRKALYSAKLSPARGDRWRDGRYIAAVAKVTIEEKRGNKLFFIAAHRVLESAKIHDTIQPNQPGTLVTSMFDLNHDMGMPNMKAYILSLYGSTEEDIAGEAGEAEFNSIVDDLTSDSQPARGMVIRAETFRSPIQTGKNAGKDFVGCNWQEIPRTREQVAELRKILDAAGPLPSLGLL